MTENSSQRGGISDGLTNYVTCGDVIRQNLLEMPALSVERSFLCVLLQNFTHTDVFILKHMFHYKRNGNICFRSRLRDMPYPDEGLKRIIRYCQYILGCKYHRTCIETDVELVLRMNMRLAYFDGRMTTLFMYGMGEEEINASIQSLFDFYKRKMVDFIDRINPSFFTSGGINPLDVRNYSVDLT